MIFHNINNEVIFVDLSFLSAIKNHQIQCQEGCYGWWISSADLVKFDNNNYKQEGAVSKVYVYIGRAGRGVGGFRSITSRFLGELVGAQITTDRHHIRFDTDFITSATFALLTEMNIDIHFEILDNNPEREVEIAKDLGEIILQQVGLNSVYIRRNLKPIVPPLDHAYEVLLTSISNCFSQYPNIIH